MYTPSIALLLALGPTQAPEPPPFHIEDVEIQTADASTHLLAYDDTGEVAAEVVVWVDSDDRPRLDIVFADGLYLTATGLGEDAVIESDDAAEVAERAQAITDYLDPDRPQEKPWVPCVLGVISTVSSCAAARPLLCPISGAAMACSCLPLIVEEWEDQRCPGYG